MQTIQEALREALNYIRSTFPEGEDLDGQLSVQTDDGPEATFDFAKAVRLLAEAAQNHPGWCLIKSDTVAICRLPLSIPRMTNLCEMFREPVHNIYQQHDWIVVCKEGGAA